MKIMISSSFPLKWSKKMKRKVSAFQEISPEAQAVLQLKDKLPSKQLTLFSEADLVYL
jgi:hypothetical protein